MLISSNENKVNQIKGERRDATTLGHKAIKKGTPWMFEI